MSVHKSFGLVVLAAGALLLVACEPTADLLPIPDPRPGFGFCKLVKVGTENRLVVTVKNQGTANAPASTTNIEFSPGGVVTVPTPAIPAGSSVDLPAVAFPVGCHNPDCDFKINVNADGAVKEANKANNAGSGVCIG